jgi:uncharacterized protein
MERRFIQRSRANVQVEERADGSVSRISGYGAVYYDGTPETEYELWPGVRERIMPGFFDRAIKEKQDVRGLFNHDPSLLLGRTASGTMQISVDSVGAKYDIEPGKTTVASDVREHISRGDVDGSSFAFSIRSETWKKDGEFEIRELNDGDIYDMGPVTYPAYEKTTAGLRYAGDDQEARSSYDKWKAESRKSDAVVHIAACQARARAIEVECST